MFLLYKLRDVNVKAALSDALARVVALIDS